MGLFKGDLSGSTRRGMQTINGGHKIENVTQLGGIDFAVAGNIRGA